MKNAAATATIRELCALGLPQELLIPALLEALHRVIASARNLFDWVDADGRIARYYFEGPIDHRTARLYFDEFHNRREAEAMPRYADVIAGDVTIRSAEELNNRRFFESALYHEIWRPQHLHYRLEAIVRAPSGRPLGSLVLYREQGDPIFDRADEHELRTLLPYIARALLQRPADAGGGGWDADASGWVNLDAAGRIVHLSADAHRLLLLAHGGITPATASLEPGAEQFATLGVVRRRLVQGGEQGPPCTVTLTNAWGRFEFVGDRLRSTRGDGDDLIGITIRRAVPSALRTLQALDAAPLSVTQKRVCALLLRGLGQREIAQRLGVTLNTAIDHRRRIYLRLGVHSHDELCAWFERADRAGPPACACRARR